MFLLITKYSILAPLLFSLQNHFIPSSKFYVSEFIVYYYITYRAIMSAV